MANSGIDTHPVPFYSLILSHFKNKPQKRVHWNKSTNEPIQWTGTQLSASFINYKTIISFSLYSVRFSRSVMSNSLQPHGLQHARFPCLSPTSGACSNSCPLSWWCHPTSSFSVIEFLILTHILEAIAHNKFQGSVLGIFFKQTKHKCSHQLKTYFPLSFPELSAILL